MPLVARALSAAKFCANPTAPISSDNSVAESTFVILRPILEAGLADNDPPTMPTFMGIKSSPLRLPLSQISQFERDLYLPVEEA